MNNIIIFFGAGIGGVLRFWIANMLYSNLGYKFAYGTLFVNVTGSFLMGVLFIALLPYLDELGSHLRALLLIGFLGGYTTFSTFSLETIIFFEHGDWIKGLLNIFISIILCIAFTWFGMIIGKKL